MVQSTSAATSRSCQTQIRGRSRSVDCSALTTRAVIGFWSNVVSRRPPHDVRSLTWLTERGVAPLDLEKAIAIARSLMGRRKVGMTPGYEQRFREIFTS